MQQLLEEIQLADQMGLDVFGIGEHHRAEFLDSAPAVILAAAATRTKNIRLTSAVTVLSAADPVRVFQEFATLDLISHGRAEIVVGRGSFVESYSLFGLRLEDYDDFSLKNLICSSPSARTHTSNGPASTARRSPAKPSTRARCRIRCPYGSASVARPPPSVRAGMLGLPLMLAIIAGEPKRFRPLVDAYREAGRRAGHPAEKLTVGLHSILGTTGICG